MQFKHSCLNEKLNSFLIYYMLCYMTKDINDWKYNFQYQNLNIYIEKDKYTHTYVMSSTKLNGNYSMMVKNL